ncbi:MAG: ABC transporter ATP-binding protein [Spirochaetales bacterium]|nr:ABC transporter ATP-binding protein [Spirochaetales bacterium]
MSVAIHVDNVVKRYGSATIIPGLSLDIKNGEFFTLLGPSGCGKTTLLRMIAGFNSIEDGTISFDGSPINNIPANRRNIGMVFQNYAIFPHLTVRQNVEYGLKLRKLSKEEIRKKVDDILRLVRIEEYANRLPERLSGGQQQRVALARAIVIHPSVLLMDEPLSNLDAKLRVEMRDVIRSVQRQVGITTVYVTHDQEEALVVSDRIAVMKGGVIQQVGKPQSIYARPANGFVSTFIGHSNLFHARARGGQSIEFEGGFRLEAPELGEVSAGTALVAAVRPEEFSQGAEGLTAKITGATFLGKYVTYALSFPEALLVSGQPSIEYSQDLGSAARLFEVGEEISLRPNPAKINIFTPDMEQSLMRGVQKYAR